MKKVVKENDQLVTASGKFIFCDSRMVSEKFGVDHNKVVRTITNFIARLDKLKVDPKSTLILKSPPVFIETSKEYRGQVFSGYEMNKTAFEHIASKFKTDKALEWQLKFIDAFAQMELTIQHLTVQKANTEWLERRASGKLTRRIETDTVQRFIAYATAQGSRNAQFYYSNISTMQNKALFLIDQKFKNIRDILDIHQIGTIEAADRIVVKALDEGMAAGLHYKVIYQNAKRNVEIFATVHGKTPVPVHQIQHSNQRQLSIT